MMKYIDPAVFHVVLLDFLERDALLTIWLNELIASMLTMMLMHILWEIVSVGVFLDQSLPE